MSVFAIGASGLAAAEARLNVSAQNVVNSQTDGPTQLAQATSGATPASDPATPKVYAPQQLVQFAMPEQAGGGVTTKVVPTPGAVHNAYDPSSSFADASGEVAAPNVDLAQETVNQIQALAQFKASVHIIQNGGDTLKATLNLSA